MFYNKNFQLRIKKKKKKGSQLKEYLNENKKQN